MDAYDFFVAKHRRDIVWDNISKLRCAYHYKQFGKYYPTAIRYLEKNMLFGIGLNRLMIYRKDI